LHVIYGQFNVGGYKCKATNSIGNSSSVINLETKGPPSMPKHVRSIDATEVSILLQWEGGFDGGYEDTKYLVQYFSDDDTIREASCPENPCNITGLKEQTNYIFRVSLNELQFPQFLCQLCPSKNFQKQKKRLTWHLLIYFSFFLL
jgi:hypothetical protein